jgi:hypothetical protein
MSLIKNGSSDLQYFIKKIAGSGKDGKIFFDDEKIFRVKKNERTRSVSTFYGASKNHHSLDCWQ